MPSLAAEACHGKAARWQLCLPACMYVCEWYCGLVHVCPAETRPKTAHRGCQCSECSGTCGRRISREVMWTCGRRQLLPVNGTSTRDTCCELVVPHVCRYVPSGKPTQQMGRQSSNRDPTLFIMRRINIRFKEQVTSAACEPARPYLQMSHDTADNARASMQASKRTYPVPSNLPTQGQA